MTHTTLERTCMLCHASELDHPASHSGNVCLVTHEAMSLTWVQARERFEVGLWPADAWEAYRRGHRASRDEPWTAQQPDPSVQAWIDRFERALAQPLNGPLYRSPVPLF